MASAVETAPAPVGASSAAVRVLKENLGDQVLAVEEFRGDLAIRVSRKAWVKATSLLRDHPELDFKLFLDLCGVDYLDREDKAERFEVVLHLYSISTRHHIRLKTSVPEGDATLDTLTAVFKGANWFEREAWDLYGIVFKGHPDLRRILTDYGFVGHPFRKDFPVTGYVEMRYDPEEKRVIYQPVTIEPREIVPRVVREEAYGESGAITKRGNS
jgi:NADH-quinone oxidoreductase subunit C